ncbi:MAG: hypothetical protein Q6J74_09355 [Gloeomargarita sp. DG02_1_bins_92]
MDAKRHERSIHVQVDLGQDVLEAHQPVHPRQLTLFDSGALERELVS